MVTVKVNATTLTIASDETLTEGRVGLEAEFEFSEEWNGLAKTAVFEGAAAIAVPLYSTSCTVPHEVFQDAQGYVFRISVTGRNAEGSIVIPTVWGKGGKIYASAESADYEESHWEPTPDIGAQIQQNAANALAIAQRVERTIQESGVTPYDDTEIRRMIDDERDMRVNAVNTVQGLIPTSVSQLTNDSQYTSKSYVDNAIAAAVGAIVDGDEVSW